LGGRDERLDENEKMKNPSATMQNYDTGSVASDQCVEISERKGDNACVASWSFARLLA
jgi:hypothetical protein